jgi:DNA-binding NtrC family response regulator
MPKMTGTILLVDDDFDLRFMLYNYFRLVGWNLITADDPPQAMRLVTEHPPDAIILDVRLRSGNASPLMAFFKEHFGKIPVVLYTSLPPDDTLVTELMNQGAHACLYKGGDLEELLKIIQTATGKKS